MSLHEKTIDMSLTVFVVGLRGVGKTHLMRKIESLLQAEGYGGVVDYGESGPPVYLDGCPSVVVFEIHGVARRDDMGFRVNTEWKNSAKDD